MPLYASFCSGWVSSPHTPSLWAASTAIAEFTRFYLERRAQESQAAKDDERKRKKLEDDFTPRVTVSFVGATGQLRREVELVVQYSFESGPPYESKLRVVPSSRQIIEAPELRSCSKLRRPVPVSCLSRCDISNAEVLSHYLLKSEISNRRALPEHTVICGYSGKRILTDEADISSVTGKLVAKTLLKRSSLSGAVAEPEHFGRCAFTNADLLKSELAVSELSGKTYQSFGQMRSAASGKTGHKSEFVTCYVTRQQIGRVEAETCQSTGNMVRPGILENCAVTKVCRPTMASPQSGTMLNLAPVLEFIWGMSDEMSIGLKV